MLMDMWILVDDGGSSSQINLGLQESHQDGCVFRKMNKIIKFYKLSRLNKEITSWS